MLVLTFVKKSGTEKNKKAKLFTLDSKIIKDEKIEKEFVKQCHRY